MTEEDEEFQRLEREAKMRALEDDDTQVYKKPWAGLTDEERNKILNSNKPSRERHIAEMIEAKLREKNA